MLSTGAMCFAAHRVRPHIIAYLVCVVCNCQCLLSKLIGVLKSFAISRSSFVLGSDTLSSSIGAHRSFNNEQTIYSGFQLEKKSNLGGTFKDATSYVVSLPLAQDMSATQLCCKRGIKSAQISIESLESATVDRND